MPLKACHHIDQAPGTYNETPSSPDREMWQQAMDNELASLEQHDTYTLVKRHNNVKIIKGRWIFSNEIKTDGKFLAKKRGVTRVS